MPARIHVLLLAALLALLAAGSAAPSAETVVVQRFAPVEDVSLPFGCDWSYDWEARCTRDDSVRLPIGGDVDKAWGAALRFSLASLTPATGIRRAVLTLFHDGTCIGPQRSDQRCARRAYSVEAYRILDPDWHHEREVAYEYWNPAARATLTDASVPGTLAFDVTDPVSEWVAEEAPGPGILLRLAPAEERFGAGGPKPPSSSFAVASRRPALEVSYVAP